MLKVMKRFVITEKLITINTHGFVIINCKKLISCRMTGAHRGIVNVQRKFPWSKSRSQ